MADITEDERRHVDTLVDYLFTNGTGHRVERLVLVDADGRDLGGWGRGPLRDAVIKFVLRPGTRP